jgi:hypothetical protein
MKDVLYVKHLIIMGLPFGCWPLTSWTPSPFLSNYENFRLVFIVPCLFFFPILSSPTYVHCHIIVFVVWELTANCTSAQAEKSHAHGPTIYELSYGYAVLTTSKIIVGPRTVLVPTQPPITCVRGVLSLETNDCSVKLTLFFISGAGLLVLRPLLAYCTSHRW